MYIGEEGLNLTHALNAANLSGQWGAGGQYSSATAQYQAALDSTLPTGNTTIGWWASAASIQSTTPSQTVALASNYESFTVSPSTFVGYTGVWYLVNPASGMAFWNTGTSSAIPVINVQDPSLTLGIWDFDQSVDVSGLSVIQGEHLGFRIGTNLQSVYTNRYPTPLAATGNNGYVDIKVMPASGTTLTALYNDTGVFTALLTQQNISTSPYTWGQTGALATSAQLGQFNWSGKAASSNVWGTGATNPSTNQFFYPAGTYSVYAESDLNNMKNNYMNGGAAYTGKTITSTVTVTLVSASVKLEANMDTVVRSKPFSVTITGKPSANYYLWLKGTSNAAMTMDNAPPLIDSNQAGVTVGEATAGAYTYLNGPTITTDTNWHHDQLG